ncbi:MAG: hypothetical protein CL947_00955 [Epsilonproteobacteria bacterium]|nr:hypothetical protein [Campylobacterota bacterium]
MMINEIIFFFHVTLISCTTLLFGKLGKEALVSYISLLFVVANIFVIKQITLFNWYATSADAFIIGVSFGINLLQETWGKEIARKTIWISFACSAFYMIMAEFLLGYAPTSADTTHIHFAHLMSHTLRIVIASFISYLITQTADTYLYAFMRKKTSDKYFVARNYISMCSSQLFDTILFSFLGLYGIMEHITHIMIVSYMIKLVAIILTTPFLMYAKKIVRK